MKYKIWDKQESLVTPTMKVKTPQEVFTEFPAAALPAFKFIVCDAPVSMAVFMEFETTKQQYKQMGVPIEDGMTDQEVLDAITYYEENPPEPEPSAEERIAGYMEYQIMMSLPTEGE